VALATLLLLLAGVGPVQPPAGRLLAARLTTALQRDTGAASVRIVYTLRPAGAAEVPLAALLFGPAIVTDIQARSSSRTLAVRVSYGPGPRTGAVVALPAELRDVDSLDLVVDYTVLRAAEAAGAGRRVRIPVLAPRWPPAVSAPATFAGEATLPEDMAAYETFPTLMHLSGESAGRRTYRVELQAVPALLSFRTAPGEAPALTLPHVLDAAMVAVLALITLAGWRYLSSRAA
jgi:hypothetical protein